MRFQAPRGTQDVLPSESHRWRFLERTFATLAASYGYKELRTPTFEDTDVFLRTAGETSDIVTKEMYTFCDKGDRSLTLKPEGTAPAMRALVEHSLCPPGAIVRMWYAIPIFRYGRPQKGRFREAHQFGIEIAGSASVVADAEVIWLASRMRQSVGAALARAWARRLFMPRLYFSTAISACRSSSEKTNVCVTKSWRSLMLRLG